MNKIIASLEAGIDMLNRRHSLLVEQGLRMLTHESGSRHLGHNLTNVATEISEIAAKLEQTQAILRTITAAQEFES